jgi:MarR family transcriptional regulator, temperature-dependent positive regulator of motility
MLGIKQGDEAMRQASARKSAQTDDSKEIYEMPGHLIRRMHQASTAIFDVETRSAGQDLTSVQFAALTVIAAQPGLDQATLASAIAYDRVTIGGVIDRLEQKGFVRREIAKGDRRSRRLHLLPAGKVALDAVTPHVRRAQDLMLQGLSQTEGATLLRLLRKALGAVGDVSRAPSRSGPST